MAEQPWAAPAPSPVAPPSERAPRLLGAAWFLLAVNVLGYYTKADLIIPLPRPAAQVITMGALLGAFGLALLLNPRVRVRPSAYLVCLAMLCVVAIASSLRFESGAGALLRCVRLTMFVATLWLLSRWWGHGLRFARIHIHALGGVLLTVLIGIVVSPAAAFSGPGDRLVGAIWPIPAPQVGLYSAVAAGLAIMLWLTRSTDARSAAMVAVPGVAFLLLSHTRTALIALIAGLVVAVASMLLSQSRARRALAVVVVLATLVATAFSQAVLSWLQRGQSGAELTSLTGRQRVWTALLNQDRTPVEQWIGVGLTDKAFGGLAIDSTWLATYYELGFVGVAIVVVMLGGLFAGVALRPPTPARACAVFLIVYCTVSSYTEVGLADASPYLLCLAVAASLLTGGGAASRTATGPGAITEVSRR